MSFIASHAIAGCVALFSTWIPHFARGLMVVRFTARRHGHWLEIIGTLNEVVVPREWTTETDKRQIFPGRCHEKACLYAMWHTIDGAMLVQGTYYDGLSHAWIELPGDVVFDGVIQRFVDKQSYYNSSMHPVPDKRYMMTDVLKLGISSKHYGPWTSDEENKAGVSPIKEIVK